MQKRRDRQGHTCQHRHEGVQVSNKARSHLLGSPRGPEVRPSPLQPSSWQSWDTGTASAPTPVLPRFAVGWERNPGSVQAVQPRPGWDRHSSGGLRQPSAGRAGGSRAHTAKGKRKEAASLIPTGPLPWPWGYQAEPSYQSQLPPHPSKLQTYFGVLGGPQQGWGAISRKGDWTVKSHAYGTLLEMGREGSLQVALCLAQSLQTIWGKEGTSCRA